ncbi:MAG: araC 4 [Anaerocolumna sp.]|jgi:AraC-like DNA-binding protein/mannose-6-phosphate isomerase-like protein (cupin superfamily)|nr:araC 4 [Anaerocolumna sp.]
MENMLYYRMGSGHLPRVRYIDQVTVKPPHVHMRRKTEEFILYYIISGEMYINEGNRSYILRTDDMLILDPNLEHYGTKTAECTYFYIHFYHDEMKEHQEEKEIIKKLLKDHRLTSLKTHECEINERRIYDIILPKYYHINQPAASSALIELLYQLRESHHNHLEYFQLKTGSIFLEFMIALSRELTSGFLYSDSSLSATRSTRMIYDLLAFFQDNYASEISSKSIEEKLGCNFDHINRMFKKATGTTIFAYLNELRISKSKHLLSDGSGKISEVAEKTGFRDVYYFSKVFKKYTGITPGAYSRKIN